MSKKKVSLIQAHSINDWVGRGTANYKYLMEVYLFDFILGVDMPEPKLCTVSGLVLYGWEGFKFGVLS